MISEIFVKIAAIVLLAAVAIVLILGIGTLFRGDKDKLDDDFLKHDNNEEYLTTKMDKVMEEKMGQSSKSVQKK